MQSFEIIYLAIAYFVAAIPFGVVLSRVVTGKDVRATGSGNIGATNVARHMGKKWGVMVLILDALKGYIVVGLAQHIGSENYCNLIAAITVFAHCYPIYLKFKGGKGVATTLGSLAALSWGVVGLAALVFLGICILTRRISPASLGAALTLPFASLILTNSHTHAALTIFVCALVWWKHKENIQRLLNKTEPRFF